MATHLVRILSQSGGIRVPGLARTLLSVADTMSRCGRHTVSLCGRHTVQVAGGGRAAGGFARNSNPTGFTNPPLPTHKIAILRCRGIMVEYQPGPTHMDMIRIKFHEFSIWHSQSGVQFPAFSI